MTRAVLFLVEGNTEQVFYKKLLQKLYSTTEEIEFDSLPVSVRELLEPLRNRRPTVLRIQNTYTIIVNCGGFEGIKTVIRRLLIRRSELLKAIKAGLDTIIVVADLDKSPISSLQGVLSSQGYSPQVSNNIIVINVEKLSLTFVIISQGHDETARKDATKQIEDYLEELASQLYDDIAKAINKLEEILNISLNTKQKVLIYEAVLETKPRAIPRIAEKLLEEASEEILAKVLEQVVQLIRRHIHS